MTQALTDEQRLRGYVDVWWHAVDAFTLLLEKVPAEEWDTPTDLPGWTVHDVVAHVAHLEATLAGDPHDEVDVGDAPHARGPMGRFTEQGVVARRDRSPDDLIREIRESATRRHTQLVAKPPTDASAPADQWAGLIGWTWERLLRNRPLDVWMHEQDVRRAVDRPGGMDSPAAQHTADYLLESLGLVVGKKVAPPAGTTVALAVEGSRPYAVSVGEDGRAHPMAVPPEAPTVLLTMDRESFVVAAGGRRAPTDVRIEGDHALGEAVVAALAVTP